MFATLPKAKDKPASRLTKQALEYLMFKGCYAWRQNNYEKRNRQHIVKKGTPDIIGITRSGIFIGLEIKIGDDRQSEDQKKFEKEIKFRDGIYAVITQFDDLENLDL